MQTDILILGAGLSGLHTAYLLERHGMDYLLVDARNRLGGRILTKTPAGVEGLPGPSGFDLGPAWFWPGQGRLQQLIRDLGLQDAVFDQFGEGQSIYEDASGQLQFGDFGFSMVGSYRLRGGMAEVVEALAKLVPAEKVRLGWRAEAIDGQQTELQTLLRTHQEEQVVHSREIVVALPPRIAAESLALSPPPTPALQGALRDTPTWMAGQAKFGALYDHPFWRQQGLSGDVFSHRGPLGELHDMSTHADGLGALFGFLALAPNLRQQAGDAIESACLDQLSRLFGDQAGHPRKVFLKDWALDELTATDLDRGHATPHESHGFLLPKSDTWHGRILWSGSETASPAPRNSGYLEGALEASERSVARLLERFEKANGVGCSRTS